MKTLIINGSTRRGGNTDALVAEFTKHLDGEFMTVTADCDIAPCKNCGYCRHREGCAISDGMTEVYRYFDECDNLVIASPVWFMTLTGATLNIASRFQTYWEARHRSGGDTPTKNGVIILTGGIAGSEAPAEKAAKAIFVTAGVRLPAVAVVKSMDTDNVPVWKDEKALADARQAARRLNGTIVTK